MPYSIGSSKRIWLKERQPLKARSRAALLLAAFIIAPALVPAAELHPLSGHLPDEVARARPINFVPGDTMLALAIGLPLRNAQELDSFLLQLVDPASPNFHRYLSAEEFALDYGPTPQDYQSLIAFAQSNHLVVTGTHPNRTLLDVAGQVRDVERAFHIRMVSYRHPARGEFYAPDREPSLDLDVPVLHIGGLDNYQLPRPMNLEWRPVNEARPEAKPYVTGSGPGGYFIGKDLRAAYAPSVTLTGSGQTVGLLEFDGFYPGDVQKNFAQAGLPPVAVQTVLLDGTSGSPGSSNTEVTLDIMMAAYMAPGLTKVIVYEGNNPDDVLNRMATDNLAQQLSSSWGFGPLDAGTEQIFKQYIAQGQSMLQASGDSGAYKGAIMSPSDDPNVTVVGGTSLATAGAGGSWQAEAAWSGSGGGISTVYPLPSYQQNLNMAASAGSAKMRNIPDVALTADIQMYLIQNNGQAVAVGGTSAAAPLWAGFIALANQQAATAGKARIGFLNPLLYALGSGSTYVSDFHDIIRGGNNGFSAVAGYDLTTGWGSPAGQHLISDLAATSGPAAFTLGASSSSLTLPLNSTGASTISVAPQNGFNNAVSLAVTGLPNGVTATFRPAQVTPATPSTMTLSVGSSASIGTFPLLVTGLSGSVSSVTTVTLSIVAPSFNLSSSAGVLTLAPGGKGSSNISVSALNGFSGSVSLSASGLPPGVTASFSPAGANTTSVLLFAAASSAPFGTYPVTVNGTSGTLKSAITINLVIAGPNFTLSVLPAKLGLAVGLTATSILTITPQNGFNGSVGLSASGLPPGITASFAALTRGGTSTVTFAAATSAATGTFPVTLAGVSGLLKSSATLALMVIAPPPTTALVNLSSVYNVNALVLDGIPFQGGGLDGGSNGSATAYSSNLVGLQQNLNGTLFCFGAANAPDAVSSISVGLPRGAFSSLKLLGTAVNGNQSAQLLKVTYTDGTVSTFNQSFSDWFTPQAYSGETRAMTMPYRDNGQGQRDNRTFYLYEYSFNVNPLKRVSSVTLPNNRNVVVLAVSLTGAVASSTMH